MIKRLATGITYLGVLIGFFMIKVLVEPQWLGMALFDILILVFCGLGTFEMIRAFREKLVFGQKLIIGIFSVGTILCYVLSDTIFKVMAEGGSTVVNYSPNFTFVVFAAGMATLFAFLVFSHATVDLQSLGASLIAYLYPSAFLLVLSGINHMPNYDFAVMGILFTFTICPFADTLAFCFGKMFGKKLPRKMAPNISPNKTLIGGLGGLFGGAVGAVCIFFLYYGCLSAEGIASALSGLNLLFFIALGILTAAFAEFGDLVESAIKRKLDIKDMGKLLPGHGGILDRIDSALYASLIVCFVFALRIMIAG